MRKLGTLVFIYMISQFTGFSQGIRGKITDENNETLPFATIYVRNLQTGTTSNAEGSYDIKLAPGKYDLVFQFMGYQTQLKVVEIKSGYTNLDVLMQPRVIVLKNVTITTGKEDPAYTIMRKAIAKSKYHTQQIDSSSAKVYIKGSGRVIDVPFFLRNKLKEEGIDSTTAFIQESVSIVKYKRPNTYEERVISIRTQGDNNNSSPNEFINGSFYDPKVAGSISPLSPKAFSYYRFTYLGYFEEQGYLINKIQVIPRASGDDVFVGTIYIVENLWSIHSLDLTTTKLGISFNVKQIYAPIEKIAWLPISHTFKVKGRFFGISFEFNYLATVSEYVITLNPELEIEFTVVDEKIDKELAKEVEAQIEQNPTPKTDISAIQEKLSSGKEITRKDLRKALKDYEKQELEDFDFTDIIENKKFTVDSLAGKSDSVYWASIRPVPLSKYEIKGYHKMDSMEVAENGNSSKDTTSKSSKKKNFNLKDVIIGDSYRFKKSRITLHSPLETIRFNTVEGYNFNYHITYRRYLENRKDLRMGPTFRYSVAREKITGKFDITYRYGERLRRNRLFLEAGRFVSQYNDDEPIHPIVNTITTLVLERNYMKLYEKEFIKVLTEQQIATNLKFNIGVDWEQRNDLRNSSNHKWINRDGEGYTINLPENILLATTSFPEHQALVANLELEYEPWQKFTIENGIKRPVNGLSPVISFQYKKGIDNAFSSDVDYDLIDLGFRYKFQAGIRGKIDLKFHAGTFLNSSKMYFSDYKHFLGNRTPFVTTDPVGSYRMLDYYLYSTPDEYLSTHIHYQFRRFLITQLGLFRKKGLKENFIVNYLYTNESDNYTELGYSIDYIFRVFRLEFITAFQNGRYQEFGIKIGIATNLDDIFDFD